MPWVPVLGLPVLEVPLYMEHVQHRDDETFWERRFREGSGGFVE